MLLIALLACDASDPMDSSDSAPMEAGIRWVVVDYVCGDGTTHTFTTDAPIDAWVMTHQAGDPADAEPEWWARYDVTVVAGATWTEADHGHCTGGPEITDGRLVIGYL